MISDPWFWNSESIAAKAAVTALTPLSAIYESASKLRRNLARPIHAPAPVICIGNITVGGVGKTPFAIMLAQIVKQCGYKPSFLSRGHGGRLHGPVLIDRNMHSSEDVGDEPLLLAQHSPIWISRSKKAGAIKAAKEADVIIMDDGFQNPTLHKDLSILLVAPDHLESGMNILPAGPLRERFDDAKRRADIIVEITEARDSAKKTPAIDFTAWLEPSSTNIGQRVFAFCGIGNPHRFFQLLERTGYEIAGRATFPDHYPYSGKEIDVLKKRADALGAKLITTEKDWVRIDHEQRSDVDTLPVLMRISDEEKLRTSVVNAIEAWRETHR